MELQERRSWKGYPWEALDALQKEPQSRAKSTCLALNGVKQAEQLRRKYKLEIFNLCD